MRVALTGGSSGIGAAVVARMKADGHEARVLERAGLPLDAYFSASKLAWILDHCDEARPLLAQGKLRLGTTDAFFLDRLAGRCVTDITTASRTSLLNLETGDWDAELCNLFGVPMQVLPRVVPTTGDFGSLSQRGRPVPVTASVVDQQASLYGHGCRRSGDAKITFGTGAFALVITGDRPRRSPEQGLLPTVAWETAPGKPMYALDGGVYCAGSAIEWGRGLGLFDDYTEINHFDGPCAIERDLVFVPALSGLACPHWDRRAAGAWIGLSLDTDRRDLIQSLLEGIAFRVRPVGVGDDADVEAVLFGAANTMLEDRVIKKGLAALEIDPLDGAELVRLVDDVIDGVEEGFDAHGKLEVGDRIVAINGSAIATSISWPSGLRDPSESQMMALYLKIAFSALAC